MAPSESRGSGVCDAAPDEEIDSPPLRGAVMPCDYDACARLGDLELDAALLVPQCCTEIAPTGQNVGAAAAAACACEGGGVSSGSDARQWYEGCGRWKTRPPPIVLLPTVRL